MKQIAFNFYSNLFHKNISFDEESTLTFLSNAELPRISVNIANLIDAKFTADEFIVVLHDFLANKKGKSTGEDGLPANGVYIYMCILYIYIYIYIYYY